MPPEQLSLVAAWPSHRARLGEPVLPPHRLDCLRPQDLTARLRQAPASEEHEVEACLVCQGADHTTSVLAHDAATREDWATSTADPRALLRPLAVHAHERAQRRPVLHRRGVRLCPHGLLVLGGCVQSHQALLRHAWWHAETSVFHTQWVEYLCLQKAIQWFPGDRLDNPPDNVQAIRVEVLLARMEAQWQSCDGSTQFLKVFYLAAIAFTHDVSIRLLFRPCGVHAEDRAVPQPGRVGEEAPQCQLLPGSLVFWRGSQVSPPGADLDIPKLRQILRHLIIELAASAFDQDHQRCGYHRLGEAIQPHNRVCPHGEVVL
mmetsp:Transcript_99223/g.256524  ORF Transcript_99223/g.256524 Transcript_99223/m.256524 type:complete len:318 (+) Transcript_99223:791-1744(+)